MQHACCIAGQQNFKNRPCVSKWLEAQQIRSTFAFRGLFLLILRIFFLRAQAAHHRAHYYLPFGQSNCVSSSPLDLKYWLLCVRSMLWAITVPSGALFLPLSVANVLAMQALTTSALARIHANETVVFPVLQVCSASELELECACSWHSPRAHLNSIMPPPPYALDSRGQKDKHEWTGRALPSEPL